MAQEPPRFLASNEQHKPCMFPPEDNDDVDKMESDAETKLPAADAGANEDGNSPYFCRHNEYTKFGKYPLVYTYSVEVGLQFEQRYIIPLASKSQPLATEE